MVVAGWTAAAVSATLLAATAAAAVVSTLSPTISSVEQVHLAFGPHPSEMAVQFSSNVSEPAHVCWGPAPSTVDHACNDSVAHAFTQDDRTTWYNHVAMMTGLKPSSKYYYKIDTGIAAPVYHFRSQSDSAANLRLPQRHIVLGDMGTKCAFTLCPPCTCDAVCDLKTCAANHSSGLVTEVGPYFSGEDGDEATMFLHVGDFAYNLGDEKGTLGDQFFRNIEQVAAYVPYMVSIGNHEDGEPHLSHYAERFRNQPANSGKTVKTHNGEAPNNMFFSWDDGLVHYIAISTELYTNLGSVSTGVDVVSQYEWLKKDLAAANANRKLVPWVVVHGHRSIYCSCDKDCYLGAWELRDGIFGLEKLFFEFGVDLFINGHEHNYERNWPTYKGKSHASNVEPSATIYIVTGAAGCSELHEPFTIAQPGRSAFRSNNFGYSRFTIHNSSHALWEQVIMDPGPLNLSKPTNFFGGPHNCTAPAAPHDSCSGKPEGSVIDSTWIVQSNHGPFNKSTAPKTVPKCTPETCQQYDHWAGRLSKVLPPSHSNQTLAMIADFRNEFGEGAWLRTELRELDAFRQAFGGANALQFEDVSEDGSSDGRWESAVHHTEHKAPLRPAP